MRALGSFDVGQAAAVRDGVVGAIEAVEGTDAALRRAAALCGRGLVVAKAAKPGQDLRFDRPAIGPGDDRAAERDRRRDDRRRGRAGADSRTRAHARRRRQRRNHGVGRRRRTGAMR